MAWPDRLLSLADWVALPEDNSRWFEVAEGVMRVAPRPPTRHQWAVATLGRWLLEQEPVGLRVLPAVEVVVFETFPVTVRVPDLVVVPTDVARTNPARFVAADVVLAIEVLTPGSIRTDTVTKFAEYAEAGIEHYWIVDTDGPATISVYQLVNGRYERGEQTSGILRVETPIPLTIDISALT